MTLESLFSDHSNGTFIQYSAGLLRSVAQALDEAETPMIKYTGLGDDMREMADSIRLAKIREVRGMLFEQHHHDGCPGCAMPSKPLAIEGWNRKQI